MKALVNVIAALGLAASSIPVFAMPVQDGPDRLGASPAHASIVFASTENNRAGARRHVRHRHHFAPRLPDQPDEDAAGYQDNGGYVVNRYGYGNYVGGPGGFAGYPAGSGAAFIYRQQENWKCEYAPETC